MLVVDLTGTDDERADDKDLTKCIDDDDVASDDVVGNLSVGDKIVEVIKNTDDTVVCVDVVVEGTDDVISVDVVASLVVILL